MNKSTIILIAVFVILGAGAYFIMKPVEVKEASYETAGFSMALDSASIVKVEIQKQSTVITLQNEGGKWMVTSPVKFPANMLNVFPILGGMGKFKVGSLVSSNPDKQGVYQVDTAGIKLTVVDRGGKSVTMYVGKSGPSYEEVYFRKDGSNDVYLGNGISPWGLHTDVNQWRDKTIFATSKDFVSRIEYGAGDKNFIVQKDSASWHIGSDSIDTNDMNTTLGVLSDFKADEFADTLSAPGSEPVHVKVTSDREVALSLYPQLPDSAKYYVQTSQSPQYFVVSKWSVQNILKPIEKYLAVKAGAKKKK